MTLHGKACATASELLTNPSEEEEMSLSSPTLENDRKVTIDITVNHVKIVLHKARVTGTEIKEAAIAAGVPIDLTFKLSMESKKGVWQIIGDNETVKVKEDAVFRAVASDDNS